MGRLRAAASTKRGLTPRGALEYIPAASKSARARAAARPDSSIRDDCVAKEEKAEIQPAAVAPVARLAALKARIAGFKRWALATRLRAILTFGALAVAFIGLATCASLAFRPAKRLDYHRQLASAFGEL